MTRELIADAQQLAASLPDGTGTLNSLRETQLVRSRLLLIALADALEAKTTQHAETLHYLEQAQRVIERDSAAYGRLLRALWSSRRLWQERIAEVEAERDAAISIARSNSHALDKARAEMETTAIELLAAHRRIAELEATQRHRLVETAEELDALPIGSVVLTIESRTAWENIAESVSLWANCGAALTAANLMHNYGAVIVVWTPELEAQVQR